jgi:hypothetical protein
MRRGRQIRFGAIHPAPISTATTKQEPSLGSYLPQRTRWVRNMQLTLLWSARSNSKAMVQTLAITMDKAYDMFAHGAYLHQYERFGIDREFFQEAFLRVDQITQNYASL